MKIAKKLLFVLMLVMPGLLLAGEVVNINTADRDELMTLSGIGKIKAQAIIDYRTENGPFEKAENLSKVSGIGDKIVEDNEGKYTASKAKKIGKKVKEEKDVEDEDVKDEDAKQD